MWRLMRSSPTSREPVDEPVASRWILGMNGNGLDYTMRASDQLAVDKVESDFAKYSALLNADTSQVESGYLQTVKRVQWKIEGKEKR